MITMWNLQIFYASRDSRGVDIIARREKWWRISKKVPIERLIVQMEKKRTVFPDERLGELHTRQKLSIYLEVRFSENIVFCRKENLSQYCAEIAAQMP